VLPRQPEAPDKTSRKFLGYFTRLKFEARQQALMSQIIILLNMIIPQKLFSGSSK